MATGKKKKSRGGSRAKDSSSRASNLLSGTPGAAGGQNATSQASLQPSASASSPQPVVRPSKRRSTKAVKQERTSGSVGGEGAQQVHGQNEKEEEEEAAEEEPEQEESQEDQRLRLAATWLRDQGPRALDVVMGGKRCHAFKGRHWLRVLTEDAIFASKFPEFRCSGKAQADRLGQRMLQAGFLFRVDKTPSKRKRRRDESVFVQLADVQDFSSEAHTLYLWNLPVSQTWNLIWGVLIFAGIILLCLKNIWPVWLKLVVWWISAVYIAVFCSVSAIRMGIFGVFWVLGWRGVWLLPNLFADNLSLLEIWSPLFSFPKRKKFVDEDEEGSEVEVVEPNWKFGAINGAIILTVIIVVCREIGLFDPQHIPEFFVTRQELFSTFPSLLPPGYVPPEANVDDLPQAEMGDASHSDVDVEQPASNEDEDDNYKDEDFDVDDDDDYDDYDDDDDDNDDQDHLDLDI